MKVLKFLPQDLTRSLALNADDLVIFLHGFPSLRSKQNRELAEIVSRENSCEVLLPLYSGLGFSEGRFTFSGCMDQVVDWATSLMRQRLNQGWKGRVQLVGHSWGGFLSLRLAQISEIKASLNRMVLMSPLVHFAQAGDVARAFAQMTARTELRLDLPEIDILAHDFSKVGQAYPAQRLIENLSPDLEVSYLQAKVDQMTPVESANGMRGSFRCHLDFRLVDQDHSFLTDRANLGVEIARLLRSQQFFYEK